MKTIKIDKTQWAAGLDRLRESYRLIGPAPEKNYHVFKSLETGQKPDLNCQNTRLSPKALVFPQSEPMMTFTLDEKQPDHHIMKAVATDDAPRAVLGIRPCDAKALKLVHLNFDTPEYKDPYWLVPYLATTFVGLACDQPCSACFCTSTDCGPYHETGLDVLLSDGGDHFVAKVLTEKGESLLTAGGWTQAIDAPDIWSIRRQAAEAAIVTHLETDRLGQIDLLALHGADFWEDIAFACINCGACTYVCPTCWCFDIQDQVHGTAGKRMRQWDSCMFPIFTVHTTGHNPRDSKTQRVRQRFMHKLKYFVEKYDQGIMCVGCGRCVRYCPVNIDIRKVCGLMNSFGSDQSCDMQA